MVDAAHPAPPESGRPPVFPPPGEGASSRRDRWIVDRPAQKRSNATWVTDAIPVLIVVALGAFLRFSLLGSQPLWVDEATSLRFAHQPLHELWSWSTIVDPGNPPLYYALLHGWLVFGDSEASLRSLSALLGVVTIPVVYALGRTVRDHRLGVVAALLFAISPMQVWYSQEARGYALLTFGATLALWGVAALLRRPERTEHVRGSAGPWLAYVLGTSIALLAHNTAVFLPIGANVLMLGWWWVRGRGLKGFILTWLLAQLAVLCAWATWLPAFVRQVQHGEAYSWIPRPTPGSVLSGLYAIDAGVTRATPYPLEAAALLALVGLGLWSWRHDRRWMAFVLIFALAAPLGELIVSVWRPIFLTQTLIWAGVPICLCVAAGLSCLRPKVFAVALAAMLVFAGLGLRSYYFLHDKEAWDQVTAYVESGVQPGDAIVFSVGFLRIPFDHYYAAPSDVAVPEVELTGGSEDVFLTADAATSRSRVWLIVSHPKASTDGVIASLGDAGRLVALRRFTDVDVYLFEVGDG